MSPSQNEVRMIVMMRGLGYKQREIADKLKVSRRTVQNHLLKLRLLAMDVEEEVNGIEKLFWKIMINYGSLNKILEIVIKESDKSEINRKTKKQD